MSVLCIRFRSSFLVCFGSCWSVRRSDSNGGIEMTRAAPTEMTIATTAAVKPLNPSSNGTDKEKMAEVAKNGSAV